jgi:hypothetical protein
VRARVREELVRVLVEELVRVLVEELVLVPVELELAGWGAARSARASSQVHLRKSAAGG